MNKYSWMMVYAFLFSFLMVMVGVALEAPATGPAEIACTDRFIEFNGLIYKQVPYDQIRSIELLRNYDLKRKGIQEGVEFEHYYNGNADFQTIGRCSAYLYLTHKDYIAIVTADSGTILFNEPTPEITTQMYDYIKNRIDAA